MLALVLLLDDMGLIKAGDMGMCECPCNMYVSKSHVIRR